MGKTSKRKNYLKKTKEKKEKEINNNFLFMKKERDKRIKIKYKFCWKKSITIPIIIPDMKLIYLLGGLAIALSVHAITQPSSNKVRVRTLKETMEQDTITEPTIRKENATFVFSKVGELES